MSGSKARVVGSFWQFRQWNRTPQLFDVLGHRARLELRGVEAQDELVAGRVDRPRVGDEAGVRPVAAVHGPCQRERFLVGVAPQQSRPRPCVLLRRAGSAVVQRVVVVEQAAQQRLGVVLVR